MLTPKRRILVFLASGLLLISIIFELMLPSPARADVGVHPVLPGGSNIEPEGETPIQMAAEVVTMNVRLASEADNAIIQLNPEAYGLQFQPVWYPLVAEVQADFTMNNPTTDVVSLTAWFPLASSLQSVSWEVNPDEIVPRIARFKVVVDGNPLDYTVSELPNTKGTDKPLLPWAIFPVTFPAGTQTSIQVSYLLPLTQAIKGTELALYYIFQTGAGWAGPIGQAELILNLPYPASSDTLVRIASGSLDMPYPMSNPHAAIPYDGVFDGNQARWTWTDFEPTPLDDFSVWLVDPVMWQGVENAQASIQADPGNGQAWLLLADRYRNLTVRGYNFPSIFSENYLQPGLEAYRKAAELLPDHPAPHTGLALLTLAPYMRSINAPPAVIQSVQDELHITKELEAAHPEWANESNISSGLVDDALAIYFGNATATAESVADATSSANQTEAAALRLTPSVTPTPHPSLTPTVIPTTSPKLPTSTPAVTSAIEPEDVLTSGQSVVIIIVVVIILLTIAGYLVSACMRGKL